MKIIHIFFVCALLFLFVSSGKAISGDANPVFDANFLDQPTRDDGWNFCQIIPGMLRAGQKTETLLNGVRTTRNFLINRVDERSYNTYCGGWRPRDCDAAVASGEQRLRPSVELEELDIEPLEPSFILGSSPSNDPVRFHGEIAKEDPLSLDVCPQAEIGFNLDECVEKPIIQRNELRLKSGHEAIHLVNDPHWYRIDFRIDGTIPSCGSVRWVIGQWKYSNPRLKDGQSQSPYFAQRFDNGIFHLTTQTNECRCLVAKAGGSIERRSIVDLRNLLNTFDAQGPDPTQSTLMKVENPICMKSAKAGGSPVDCKPGNLKVYTHDGQMGILPDPKADWVRMLYKIKGGPTNDGQIDIYANGTFVARVEGLIGYETRDGDYETGANRRFVKFKVGQYRDKIPFEAALLLDRICISKDAKGCLTDSELEQINLVGE